MKKILLGSILILALFQACNKNDDLVIPTCENCSFTCLDTNDTELITNNCIDNWECNFIVTPQSKVDLTEREGLAGGTKNVFQMINSTQGDLSIADDELTNILVFELEASQNSFSIEDRELEDMKVHYRRICYCVGEVDFKAITSGCLQGEKQSDGAWFVQGKLNVSYSFGDLDIKVDAQFVN